MRYAHLNEKHGIDAYLHVDCFFPEYDRKKAEQALTDKPAGTMLLRYSQLQSSDVTFLVLDVVKKDNQFDHFLLVLPKVGAEWAKIDAEVSKHKDKCSLVHNLGAHLDSQIEDHGFIALINPKQPQLKKTSDDNKDDLDDTNKSKNNKRFKQS